MRELMVFLVLSFGLLSPKPIAAQAISPEEVEAEREAALWGHESIVLEAGPTVGGGEDSTVWWSLGIGGAYHFDRFPLRIRAMLFGGGVVYDPKGCNEVDCARSDDGGVVGGGFTTTVAFAPLGAVDSLDLTNRVFAPWIGPRYSVWLLAPSLPEHSYENEPEGGSQLMLEAGTMLVLSASRANDRIEIMHLSVFGAYGLWSTTEPSQTFLVGVTFGFGSLFPG